MMHESEMYAESPLKPLSSFYLRVKECQSTLVNSDNMAEVLMSLAILAGMDDDQVSDTATKAILDIECEAGQKPEVMTKLCIEWLKEIGEECQVGAYIQAIHKARCMPLPDYGVVVLPAPCKQMYCVEVTKGNYSMRLDNSDEPTWVYWGEWPWQEAFDRGVKFVARQIAEGQA